VEQTNSQQPKTNSFLVILLSSLLIISCLIAGFFAYQTQKLVIELTLLRSEPISTPNLITEGEILALQITTCCSCPAKIPRSLIGTDGWVIYEKGKDYSDLLPAICKTPNIGVCAPCPPLEEDNQGKIDCTNPRPEVCTLECTDNICGSDGKRYCSPCQACSNAKVNWYEIKTSVCKKEQL